MTIHELEGKYTIIGKNQSDSADEYKGVLTLTLNQFNRVEAEWVINNSQIQKGNGFFKDNILVLSFNYTGDDYNNYSGIVVYKCLTKDLLEGFWSEDYGNPLFLGEERCFRIKNLTVLH